jgi:c-di-GMP-binding flagellar brake protein YcgR
MADTRKVPVEVPEDHRKGNRRAFPRWKMDFSVRYQPKDKWLDAQPCEIGEGGLSFFVENLVPLESEIFVQYRLGRGESKDEWITVKSIVRHAKDNSLGVEFLNLRRNDRLKILDFVNQPK